MFSVRWIPTTGTEPDVTRETLQDDGAHPCAGGYLSKYFLVLVSSVTGRERKTGREGKRESEGERERGRENLNIYSPGAGVTISL